MDYNTNGSSLSMTGGDSFTATNDILATCVKNYGNENVAGIKTFYDTIVAGGSITTDVAYAGDRRAHV